MYVYLYVLKSYKRHVSKIKCGYSPLGGYKHSFIIVAEHSRALSCQTALLLKRSGVKSTNGRSLLCHSRCFYDVLLVVDSAPPRSTAVETLPFCNISYCFRCSSSSFVSIFIPSQIPNIRMRDDKKKHIIQDTYKELDFKKYNNSLETK